MSSRSRAIAFRSSRRTSRCACSAAVDWSGPIGIRALRRPSSDCGAAQPCSTASSCRRISNCDLGLNPLLWTAGEEPEFVFFAFDLLHWDDDDLRSLPLAERRQHLVRRVSLSEISRLHLVQIFNDGDRLLAEAERMELQGIVSKRWGCPVQVRQLSRLDQGQDKRLARDEQVALV